MLKKFFKKEGLQPVQAAGSKNKKAEVGRLGEQTAEKYLKKKGYRIQERNFSGRFGEVDIIAFKGEALVFIEVKTRSGSGYAAPKEAVDARKVGRIIKAAYEYMQRKGLPEDTSVRFDVIGITTGAEAGAGSVENEEMIIEHIEAAFDAC
ncbi:hypothetical protein MNBD_DELTA01-1060 [hydrothermal vent metagenome]|uniref:Uncharacterized protein n=1 Tax=hydrothermal vent metagenome TaxID=652676 RepID=A0A3B0QWA9_9ZZZZ